MRARLLVWISFGLAVLFGLAALIATDPSWRRFLGGFGCLFLGGFSLGLVGVAIRSGRMRVRSAIVYQANQPWFFWFNIALFVFAGLVMLASAIRLWFLLGS